MPAPGPGRTTAGKSAETAYSDDGSSRSAATQADFGYRRLRREIIACKVLPGSKLKINELAVRFGVSVSAMREALSRLVTEDLVVATAQRGFTAAPISTAEMIDLTKTRTAIETLCLLDAVKHGRLDWEGGIVAAFHKLSRLQSRNPDDPTVANEEWIAAHAAFHFALLAACSSPTMLKIRDGLHARSERYRQFSGIVGLHSRDLNAEHKALMNAALARDEARVAARIKDHFAKTTALILDAQARSASTA